jgi:NAD(P)H-dependent flavin oxidoreductase YrpB (nitropropane dioxygenase family)
MLRTRFMEMASCPVPIQQAGMGGVSQPRLAAGGAPVDAGMILGSGLTC